MRVLVSIAFILVLYLPGSVNAQSSNESTSTLGSARIATQGEMQTCPYCLEEVKVGARKCPHCQSSLGATTENADTTVYILDKGLIRFGKFVGAALALFTLVGVTLFGYDLKQASEKATQAKLAVESSSLEIEKQRASLDEKILEIEERIRHIEQLEREIASHRKETGKSASQVRQLLVELRSRRDEAHEIILELRTLGTYEATVALAQRQERGIRRDRGKLWTPGTSLRYHFLDGDEDLRAIVRAAIEEWSTHVNLSFSEGEVATAEIRISFEQPGSWSYGGTDTLGISGNAPTLNYGYLASLDREEAMQTALHEFGHTLGLVHEFQNPSEGEIFDREAVLSYFKGPPNNWREATIMQSVLDKDTTYPGARPYDPESIMNKLFPPELFEPGMETRPLMVLSESDKSYVASLYP